MAFAVQCESALEHVAVDDYDGVFDDNTQLDNQSGNRNLVNLHEAELKCPKGHRN